MVLRESMRRPPIYRGKWARTLVASYVEMVATGRVLVIRRVWSGRLPPDTWGPADRSSFAKLNHPTHLWSVLNYECCSDTSRSLWRDCPDLLRPSLLIRRCWYTRCYPCSLLATNSSRTAVHSSLITMSRHRWFLNYKRMKQTEGFNFN